MKLIDHLIAPKGKLDHIFVSEKDGRKILVPDGGFIQNNFPDNVRIWDDAPTNSLHIYVYGETYKKVKKLNVDEYKETSVKRKSKRQHRRRTT